jgi:hypothetical protein
LRGGHVPRAGDGTFAAWGAADALEGLRHVPFGGGVEEGQLVAGLEPLGADEEGALRDVENLEVGLAMG